MVREQTVGDNLLALTPPPTSMPARFPPVFKALTRLPLPLLHHLAARAARRNHDFESLIRQCPGQHSRSYNRYKAPAGAEPPPA